MEWIVNAKEMKLCDQNTMQYYGIPSMVLMERAALKTVDVIMDADYQTRQILIVCGVGNNGGDGMAIARLLAQRGCCISILLIGDNKKFTDETKKQYEICKQYQIPFVSLLDLECTSYTLIIDALFGVGLSRNLSGEYYDIIEKLNHMNAGKIAIDIPSGISADNGAIMGTAFRADTTITFAYRKLGLVLYPGVDYAGKVIVADIGIDDNSWLDKKPGICTLDDSDMREALKRSEDGNKGTFGKVLVIAGSINMAGAAYFTAKAAYKSGCGLVRIYTVEENRTMLQTKLPEALLTTYSAKKPDMQQLNEALEWAETIVIGPGIGTDDTANIILKNTLKNAAVPIVVDADALNLIANDTQILLKPHTEMVVTPHMGEMARLCGDSITYLKENRMDAAEEFAREYNVVCVLKDARTVTAVPYGRTYINQNGNSGMATGGSGDVLAGLIAGLIAQGIHSEFAAPAAVYLHAKAGDEAAKKIGKHAMIASDILEHLFLD
jgi:NAD(P)H-hydrate epimerase